MDHHYFEMVRANLSKSSQTIQRGHVAVAESIALLKRLNESDSRALIASYSAASIFQTITSTKIASIA